MMSSRLIATRGEIRNPTGSRSRSQPVRFSSIPAIAAGVALPIVSRFRPKLWDRQAKWAAPDKPDWTKPLRGN